MLDKKTYLKFISKKEVSLLTSVLDILAVIFFVISTFINFNSIWVIVLDIVFLSYFILDYGLILHFSDNKKDAFFNKYNLVDLIVILSFIPTLGNSLTFLRSFRLLRVVRLYHVYRVRKEKTRSLMRHETAIQSIINLFVFVMISTGIIYVFQVDVNPQINNYLDALYFTISTISTTGYGDITPIGEFGFIVSIMIMILGITLFFKFANDVIRPEKISYRCKKCGLIKHDIDAVRCKHCGKDLKIKHEGL